ncbi:MAG: hypothetical protein IT431_14655 [Phycisphaerales bacterium]|nr:hypothetical protein [Phycisphaerales bacterium]
MATCAPLPTPLSPITGLPTPDHAPHPRAHAWTHLHPPPASPATPTQAHPKHQLSPTPAHTPGLARPQPAQPTRRQQDASIAGLLLTTDAAIVEKKYKATKAAVGGGDNFDY